MTENVPPMYSKSQWFETCQLAHRCTRITLTELKGSTSQSNILNIARQRSALGLKTFVSRPERLENHAFHDFWDLGHQGVSRRQPVLVLNFFAWKAFGLRLCMVKAFQTFVPGKMFSGKMNLQIFRYDRKCTPDVTKKSMIWDMSTSSPLHPNYSYRA